MNTKLKVILITIMSLLLVGFLSINTSVKAIDVTGEFIGREIDAGPNPDTSNDKFGQYELRYNGIKTTFQGPLWDFYPDDVDWTDYGWLYTTGYKTVFKVNNGSENVIKAPNASGSASGVTVTTSFQQITESDGSKSILVIFSAKNNNGSTVTVDISTFADLCVGDDDNTPLRVIYQNGEKIGFTSSNLKGNTSQTKVSLNYFFKNNPYIAANTSYLQSQTMWTGSYRAVANNKWTNNLVDINPDAWHEIETEANGWTDVAFAASWRLSIPAWQTGKVSYVLTTVNAASSYSVTYNPNGGSGSAYSKSASAWSSYTFENCPFSRIGYKCIGWDTSASATTPKYTQGGTITLTNNMNLYAIWEKSSTPLTKPTLSGSYTYNGSLQTAKLSNFDPNTMSVSGNTRTNAGTQTITISLKDTNNYTWADGTIGNVTISWTIAKKSISVSWGSTTTFTYNGSAQAPTASASSGISGQTLNISRSTATNVGNYTSTAKLDSVTGGSTDNYTLTNPTKAFTIVARTISDGSITINPTSFTYNGGENKPTPTLVVNGKTLVNGTDYTVNYSDNINAGSSAKITLTGKGNYKDTKSTTFTINPKKIATVWSNTSFVYNASAQKPTATASTGVNGETVTLTVSGAQTNVGTYTATASIASVSGGQGKTDNYTLTNTTTDFTIVVRNIDTGSLALSPNVYTYNGGENKPTPAITVNNITLVKGIDYTVSYKNNIDVGTGTTTLVGIGNYTGTISQNFTIKKKDVSVVWGNTTLVYNGSAQKPTATVDSGVTGETITLAISGEQTDTGTYTATATMISVSGGRARLENYNLLNSSTEFIINKANRNLVAPDVTVVYDGAEHKIVATQVGDGVIQYSENNSLINAGSVVVRVWVEESANWLPAETTATLTILKQKVPVIWTNTTILYSGLPEKPTATATAKGPENVDVVATLTITGEQTEVGGPYVATAIPDNPNYTLEPSATNFKIVGNPNITFTGSLDPNIFIYDGTEKRPKPTIIAHGTPGVEGKELKEGKDYIVTYENNIEPGNDATVKITGIGNYEGNTLDLKFTIDKIERKSIVNIKDYYYGTILPTPSITDSKEAENISYYYQTVNTTTGGTNWSTVADAEGISIGTYYMYASIPETAHYKAYTTTTTGFRVLPGEPIDPTVENKVYNGELQTGVYGGKGIILSGTTSAIEVGTYVAYGNIADNYEWPDNINGQKEYTWKIYPCNINNTEISLNPTVYQYDGTAHEPTVTVKFNGTILVEGKDYSVEYRNNINAGRAEAVITGLNNFSGVYVAYFTITPLKLDRVILENYIYYYTGEKIKPSTLVYGEDNKKLVENKDYVAEYYSNIDIGTAYVTVIGIGNYTGELNAEFQILGKDILKANVKLIGVPYTYDGSEKCPKAEVILEGNTLLEGRDYVINYENNINAGENTAIAKIIGVGEYTGEIEIPFTIMKAYREADILAGKALLIGKEDVIPYYYKGEDAVTTLTIDDNTIVSAKDKVYSQEGTIDLTGLKVGNTTLSLKVDETSNYHELILKSKVTVFEKEEDTYPIYGTVVINDNDEYTNTPRTMLTLNVDFGEYMYISENPEKPALDDSEWYEFSRKMPYEFNATEGEKVIYAWFKDEKGNMSSMAMDTIILKYDATVPLKKNNTSARDYVLLDETPIDTVAPSINFEKYYNKSLDIEVVLKQKDIMVNGVRSGIDHATIKYGYREVEEGLPNDVYQWQDTPIIKDLKYDKDYAFVTRAYDRAGNGFAISEETLIHTERKYVIKPKFEDTNCQYTGEIQKIKEAEFTLVNNTPITGTLTYTYYVDKDCTVKTTPARDGSEIVGGAPSQPGIYYVTLELKGDLVYYDIPEDGEETPMAELRIGWNISKTENDDVFAYPERVDIDSEEYNLHVIGNGEMIDLESLLMTNQEEKYVYWVEYKNKIVKLEIANDVENQIQNIGANIFNHLEKITEISIPDTIVSIGDYAFEGCTSVNTKIVIPTSVTEIGANPFANVNTPEFETEFGHRAFETINGVLVDINHEKLIAYPNGMTDERYTIPEEIKAIEKSAFQGSDYLKNIVIPNGIENIETRAFYDCINLEIVEIEDLMEDNILELKNIGNEAFSQIKNGSIIYTFSEEVAKKFKKDETYLAKDTEVYWPPIITLQPIDMNGAEGRSVKYIIDTKPGYPEETKYQWYKYKDNNTTLINGAISKEYTTPSLTMANHNDYYYTVAYNDDYYYNRSYVSSRKARLNMLTEANYIVERGSYNSYLFERLQDAFDFAITDDLVKPLKNVSNEKLAILNNEKSIQFDLESYKIELDEIIKIENGSKLEIVSDNVSGGISKNGEYIIENEGELVINGKFTLSNVNGFGIKTIGDSTLTFTSGNLSVDRNAIYAENATVTIDGAEVRINANTLETNAAAVIIQKNTKFNMTNGNITIAYRIEPTSGNLYGIYFNGDGIEVARILGGTITANSTKPLADAIANGGKSDIIIGGDSKIIGTRSGVTLLDSDLYGDIIVETGTIEGGVYGILNYAQSAKVILGREGEGVSTTLPIVVGEKVAIFNTKEKDTFAFYDGILYSRGNNIVYEDINNNNFEMLDSQKELIYTAKGRSPITIERNYSIFTENAVTYNGFVYHAAYLKENRLPTVTDPQNQVVKVGEQAVFEVIASGGHPDIYDYQWEVSIDGGKTWISVTLGVGGTTSRYTTPLATSKMDGYMYRCVVTNARGSVISKEVTLIVIENEDDLQQRPVVRIVFANGRKIEIENRDGKEEKVINMKLIAKSITELKSLKLNGEEILNKESFKFADGTIEVLKDSSTPIILTKVIDGKTENVEYTYTYNLKVYKNGIMTVDVVDIEDRDNTTTQTIDLFCDLKVQYYLSKLTEINKNLIITFYANKPVRPTSSIVNSYRNGTYLELVSLDGGEYSYRYHLELDKPLSETIFWFEDDVKNEAFVKVDAIPRVSYRNIKFNKNLIAIEDLNILNAYEIAQELEDVPEVNANEEIQNRYGVNNVQTDIFMSRARDIGAVDILNDARDAKSYDGIFTSNVNPVVTRKDIAYDYVATSENIYVAASSKDREENEFTKQDGKYVDIISRAAELYKGIDIGTFRIDDLAPYMYTNSYGPTNISAVTIAKASFRATIIGK